MPTLEELQFAQHFPFSSAAKKIVKKLAIPLEEIPEEVINRATLMISNAAQNKQYVFLGMQSTDLLKQEILAFPIAKILLSFLSDPMLYPRFSSMVEKSTFNYLEKEKNKGEAILLLAADLGLGFELSPNENFFVSLPLDSFLRIQFNDPLLKLVNQQLANGRIFLDENKACRFVAETVFLKVLNSLPVETANIPDSFKKIARDLMPRFRTVQRKAIEFRFGGRINPGLFPPCIAELYEQLLAGKNLPHLARFDLATFLTAIGMRKEQVISLFKKAPNFNEKITRYQIERIIGQRYAPASCSKLREHQLCIAKNCNVRHPLGYYRRELSRIAKEKEAKKR